MTWTEAERWFIVVCVALIIEHGFTNIANAFIAIARVFEKRNEIMDRQQDSSRGY